MAKKTSRKTKLQRLLAKRLPKHISFRRIIHDFQNLAEPMRKFQVALDKAEAENTDPRVDYFINECKKEFIAITKVMDGIVERETTAERVRVWANGDRTPGPGGIQK